MPNEIERIVTLPIRLGLRATRIVLRPVSGVAGRVLGLVGRDGDGEAAPAPSERVERPPSTWRPQPRTAPAPPAAATAPAEPEVEAPAHVSEEPVLVAESADEGAEDGVGAAISVAEPWEGYRRMKADEILARIDTAEREELAVIQLYEGMNRRRKTVLEAAERRLKVASPPTAR
jgi:hypothetical protein